MHYPDKMVLNLHENKITCVIWKFEDLRVESFHKHKAFPELPYYL